MVKTATKPSGIAGSEVVVLMRAPVRLREGTHLFFPYSNEVAAGEPSVWKDFHAKYHNQPCTVVAVSPGRRQVFASVAHHYGTTVTVRFNDGCERSGVDPTIGFVFIA